MLDQANLLLDVGNTSIKYAWYEPEQDIADLQILRTTIEGLSELLAQTKHCVFCNVQAQSISDTIIAICQQQKVSYEQVHTCSSQFGIQNAYHTYQNMGTDRWMAIVAGGALSDRNYLVVDAGTAITCDFVVAGKHIGGWIAPGFQLARHAVVSNTSKVFDAEYMPDKLQAGDNTPECVAQGALAQISGMLNQAKIQMYRHSPQFDVFISGGDARLLIQANHFEHEQRNKSTTTISDSTKNQHLNAQGQKKAIIFPEQLGTTNYLENLVLVGLARIVHEKS